MNASFAFHVDATQPGRTRQGFAPPRPVGRVLDGTCPAATTHFSGGRRRKLIEGLPRKAYIARGTYSGGKISMGVGWVNGTARWRCPEGVVIMSVVDLDMPLPLALAWRRDNTSPLLANFIADVRRLPDVQALAQR